MTEYKNFIIGDELQNGFRIVKIRLKNREKIDGFTCARLHEFLKGDINRIKEICDEILKHPEKYTIITIKGKMPVLIRRDLLP